MDARPLIPQFERSNFENVCTFRTSSHAKCCSSYLSLHGSSPSRTLIVADNGFRLPSVILKVCCKSSSAAVSPFPSSPAPSSSSSSRNPLTTTQVRMRKRNAPRRSVDVCAPEEDFPGVKRRFDRWSASRVRTRNENAQQHSFDFSALGAGIDGTKCMLNHWLLDLLSNCDMKVSQAARKGLIVSIVVTILLTGPTVTFSHGSFSVSDNIAVAQPIRQLALFLERLAGGSTSSKVIDRLVTVISGQTVVTPETVEQLKSVIDGEKDITDLQTDIANNVESLWTSAVDIVLHFDPLSLIDSAGTSIQGLFEIAAERFAAFELSTLVALGERWLLWTPFVMLPMYWQMSRNRAKEENVDPRVKIDSTVEVSEDVKAKAVRVREELERLELKSSLFEMVSSLGKMAWQISGADRNQTRKEIDKILTRLLELNPAIADVSALPSTPEVDGDWMLMYVSEVPDQSQPAQLPAFPSLDLFGIELSDMRQRVWLKQSRSVTSDDEIGKFMMANNTAKVRLGPLGVVELSVEGPWENLTNGKGAVVSFQTFYARPIEVLGTLVREDLPSLGVSIPQTLRTNGEWETVYLDNSIRINRGQTGQFYLFRRA